MTIYVIVSFLGGFGLCLTGFGIFMHFECRRLGDNQFVTKLLPPPEKSRLEPGV